MGYVKTPEEIERYRRFSDVQKGITFSCDALSVEFTTTPEFVAEVLPPCLEPAGEPSGLVLVGSWQKYLDGKPGIGPGLEFDTAIVWVLARRGDREGWYALTKFVSGDMSVSQGREIWGEIKKTGTARLYRDSTYMYGYGERNGVRVIQIETELGPDQGPQEATGTNFELKGVVDTDGKSLCYEPRLNVFGSRDQYGSYREGPGRLVFTGTHTDPVDTIPVVSVGTATHVTGMSTTIIQDTIMLGDDAPYAPYVIGRSYDHGTDLMYPPFP